MYTIICKTTGQQIYGKVVEGPRKVCRIDGEIIDYWVFESIIGEDLQVWECHSDYWDLTNTDLLKVSHALRINESQEPKILEKLKNILKWGFCK